MDDCPPLEYAIALHTYYSLQIDPAYHRILVALGRKRPEDSAIVIHAMVERTVLGLTSTIDSTGKHPTGFLELAVANWADPYPESRVEFCSYDNAERLRIGFYLAACAAPDQEAIAVAFQELMAAAKT